MIFIAISDDQVFGDSPDAIDLLGAGIFISRVIFLAIREAGVKRGCEIAIRINV